MRNAFLIIHRYVGLTIATFLVVAGLTGSALAFLHELEGLINPHLRYVSPPSAAAEMLDPLVLRERFQQQLPNVPVQEVIFDRTPGESLSLWLEPLDPATGKPSETADNDYFFDPYTGALLGSRHWGDLTQGVVNLMPFVYRLHYQLALGDVGEWLFGIVALLWTIDCFIGMYLTFPARRVVSTPHAAPADKRSWLARWRPSWLVRGGSLFGATFTFHRASGLWVWPLLFVFAWSAVGFNLRPVFTPVMGVFGMTPNVRESLPKLEKPKDVPALDWLAAQAVGQQLMAEQAAARDFTVITAGSLSYEPAQGLYRYDVKSSLDLNPRWPGTRLWFDGDSGAFHAFDARTGQAIGNTLSSWLFALHMGTVGGLAYRIVVCAMGLIIAALCVTGVMIWWRKRALRRKAKRTAATSSEDQPRADETADQLQETIS